MSRATPEERVQAWADLTTALSEVFVPPLEAIVRFLQRVIDRLSPPKPFERSLSVVGRDIGRVLDGTVGWIQANPQILAWAAEVEEWKAKAAALGADDDVVDLMVEKACQYAAERGLDPMTVARDRWEDVLYRLCRGDLEALTRDQG